MPPQNTVWGGFRLNFRHSSFTVRGKGDFGFMGGYRKRPGSFLTTAVFFVALCLSATAETNFNAGGKDQPAEGSAEWSQHVVQSYQQLQEQQRSMLVGIEQARQDAAAATRAVEQARQDAEASAKRNSEEVETRLNHIEQSVTAEREREIETVRLSQRSTLITVGIFASLGFLGILFFVVFLLRIMNRRTETLITQFTGQMLGPGFTPAALTAGGTHMVPASRVEQSTARFVSTIERLEKRINELEGTTEPLPDAESGELKNPAESPSSILETHAETPEPETAASRAKTEKAERDARIALLLGKGQALLSLHQADTALVCFDEAIALDSTIAEAFIKKGVALEKLGKLDEAIDCYDRAIALDDSMTMAYLNKGGVFNRLERYGEALQCYEQALRAQQKPSIA
jgi:tetratricopeptide (TPR) repeat protein